MPLSGYPLHRLSMPIRLPGDSTRGEGVRTAAEKRYWVLITPGNSDIYGYLLYGFFGDLKRRESDHSAVKIGPTRMLACIILTQLQVGLGLIYGANRLLELVKQHIAILGTSTSTTWKPAESSSYSVSWPKIHFTPRSRPLL